jgi:hypothetical protein
VNSGPLWADLHNHNAIGYGQGALDRSLEITLLIKASQK